MTHYVALLRGINVGGHVVRMDRLRALFAEAGLSGVQTFIASGNVLFSAHSFTVAARSSLVLPSAQLPDV
jgi:uncharacterized protein (DUF1697 family)